MKTYRFVATYNFTDEIYRIIDISEDQTLDDFHQILFDAFDREEEHLYSFFLTRRSVSSPRKLWSYPEYAGSNNLDNEAASLINRKRFSTSIKIRELHLKPRQVLYYLFDYGDEWIHKLKLKSILNSSKDDLLPAIVESVGESLPQYPLDDDEEEDDGILKICKVFGTDKDDESWDEPEDEAEWEVPWRESDFKFDLPVFVTSDRTLNDHKRLFGSLTEILIGYDRLSQSIDEICKISKKRKEPFEFHEWNKLFYCMKSLPAFQKLKRSQTETFFDITAGSTDYSPENRLNMAYYFLSGTFTRMKPESLFQKTIELKAIPEKLKQDFIDHFLTGTNRLCIPFQNTFPKEQDKSILENILPEIIMPTSTIQYAAYWKCMLSDTTEKQVISLDKLAMEWDAYLQDAACMGIVRALHARFADLSEPFINTVFNRYLGKGNGSLRKLIYKLGWDLFGVGFIKRGLNDPSENVRKEVIKLSNKPHGGQYGEKPRQQTLF